MKTNENNLSPVIDERRKPGDVYMILSPEGKVKVISTVDLIYKRFTDFINDGAFYALRDHKPPYMNDFFVQYHFPDPKMIPSWDADADTNRYFNKLQTAILELGLKPVNTARLYPAMYCYTRSLEPLAPENTPEWLDQNPEYHLTTLCYSGFKSNIRLKGYTGIETDRGVLLFDDTDEGYRLQQEYRSFFAENFFDPRLGVTFFRRLELIPTQAQKAKANPDLGALYEDGPDPFGELPEDSYTNAKKIGIHTVSEHIDMEATLANFTAIAKIDQGIRPDMPDDTRYISWLLYLSSSDWKDPLIYNLFSCYDRFDTMIKRIAETGTETEKAQVADRIRNAARYILQRNFPNIRQPKQTAARREQDKAVVTQESRRVRQLPDVAGRLAKQPKKGKGITR